MPDKSNSNKIVLIVASILVAGALIFAAMSMAPQSNADNNETSSPALAVVEEEVDAMPVPEESADEVTEAVESLSDEAAVAPVVAAIDPQHVLRVTALGNPDAPVKIEEFASLTCGHCAHFHAENYEKLKAEYIDTGKVYFVYNDFPLNAPAMAGTIIARCLPEDRYFQFVSFLFETQDKWAYQDDYLQILKQNAKLLGGNETVLDACLDDESLRAGVAAQMQEAQKKYDINSTPSIVLNGEKTLRGSMPYEQLKKEIDALLPASEK
ncbi:MAG: DsbA family protein [Rhodospirillales bacterium]|nr:DsbA family protein [Rhodospirillales bacterium]